MGDMQPAAGSLLIASATLVDPNFARCVLVILESNDDGSLGVILNQPSETPVGEVLDQWRDVVNPPGVFFRGGPVELNAALAIGIRGLRRRPTARLAAGVRVARDGGPRRLARRPPRPARRAAHLRGVRRLGVRPARRRDRGGQLARRTRAARRPVQRRDPTGCGATSCAGSHRRCRCWPRCPRTPVSTESAPPPPGRPIRQNRPVADPERQMQTHDGHQLSVTTYGPDDAPLTVLLGALLDPEPAGLALPGARPAARVRPRHPHHHLGPPRTRRVDAGPPLAGHHRAAGPRHGRPDRLARRRPGRSCSPGTPSAA